MRGFTAADVLYQLQSALKTKQMNLKSFQPRTSEWMMLIPLSGKSFRTFLARRDSRHDMRVTIGEQHRHCATFINDVDDSVDGYAELFYTSHRACYLPGQGSNLELFSLTDTASIIMFFFRYKNAYLTSEVKIALWLQVKHVLLFDNNIKQMLQLHPQSNALLEPI